MFRPAPLVLSAALIALLPGAVLAQAVPVRNVQAETGQPPQRIRSVTVTGSEPCPASTDDEIVVCSRLKPDEQFRIPSALRESPEPAANQSWVNRAATVDNVSKVAGGLPDTCSPVGTGGQSGCALQLNRAYAADRRARAAEERITPGGEE